MPQCPGSGRMKFHPELPPREWARRVNRAWIVHGGLADHAEQWLNHLAELNDGREESVCLAAMKMCDRRNPMDDPKPWFYAGLFSLAAPDEAKQYLSTHRVTKATVPSMMDDEEVRLWEDRASEETHELLRRLREAVRSITLNLAK